MKTVGLGFLEPREVARVLNTFTFGKIKTLAKNNGFRTACRTKYVLIRILTSPKGMETFRQNKVVLYVEEGDI